MKYRKAKSINTYKSFSITEADVNKLSLYEIWDKINEIRAFRRFYILVSKNKQISTKSILLTIFIILTGIPIKMWNICKALWKSEYILRTSLVELYHIKYWEIQNCKIEIINKEVYINCYTRKDVIKTICKINPHMKDRDICVIYKDLIKTGEEMKKDIIKYEKLRKAIPFELGKLTTEEGIQIKKAHFTTELNLGLRYGGRDHIKAALHGTSKIPELLTSSQFTGIAMQSLLKHNSPNPGSIFTSGNYKFTTVKEQTRWVQNWEIQRVKYSVELIKDQAEFRDLFTEWDLKFEKALKANLSIHGNIIEKFASGHHNLILEADSNKSEKELIEEIKRELKDIHNE